MGTQAFAARAAPAAVVMMALGAGADLPAAAPATRPVFAGPPGAALERHGDEIVVCGRFFHTTAPVVLWFDAGGYDAYRLEPRFAAAGELPDGADRPAARYAARDLTDEESRRVRDRGWDLPLLRQKVDKLVVHYDACGTSRQCFAVLHDRRGLSCHFLLDIDGTIYQTLDLKERAWHATVANAGSVGIEIANVGAFAPQSADVLQRWYVADADGLVRIVLPQALGDGGVRPAGFVGRPARNDPVTGTIQGRLLRQYDFTAEQYDSLIRLVATLCIIFPAMRCDYPRDGSGQLVTRALTEDQLQRFSGVLGHFHVQANKVDPGPAFQWDRVIDGARALMSAAGGQSPATRPAAEPAPRAPSAQQSR